MEACDYPASAVVERLERTEGHKCCCAEDAPTSMLALCLSILMNLKPFTFLLSFPLGLIYWFDILISSLRFPTSTFRLPPVRTSPGEWIELSYKWETKHGWRSYPFFTYWLSKRPPSRKEDFKEKDNTGRRYFLSIFIWSFMVKLCAWSWRKQEPEVLNRAYPQSLLTLFLTFARSWNFNCTIFSIPYPLHLWKDSSDWPTVELSLLCTKSWGHLDDEALKEGCFNRARRVWRWH